MIHEVRIFSKIGSSIYAAEMEIIEGGILSNPIESPSLFSSMMSAILSFDSEVRSTQVREFIYEDNKAVLHFLGEIAFLIYADNKVRNSDLTEYLTTLADLWLDHFEDKEYMMMTDKELKLVNKLVNDAITEVFWWIDPYPTIGNIANITFDTLLRPNSTYYFRYLSNYYYLLSIVIPLLITITSWQFGVVLSGFSPRNLAFPALLNIVIPILILWLGPGLFLKASFGNNFHLRGFYTISGIMSLYLIPVILMSSNAYNEFVQEVSLKLGILQQFGLIFLLVAPLNIVFFGYFLMTGFATSFANQVKQSKFIIAYILTSIFLISVTSIISF